MASRARAIIAETAHAASGLLPGLLLCIGVTLVATGLEWMEIREAGRAWLEALVLAILVGTTVRTSWPPGPAWTPGIHFSARILLEVAVVLLGASVSARTVLAVGPGLLAGIAGLVGVVIVIGYGLGRVFGLPHRMAMLVACGNAICGNSAIAAVAPVIGADGEDVAASIAFTAVLGVVVVLVLPLLRPVLHLGVVQFGAWAGLTVYAVPQVLAATAPVGAMAAQIGTLVKLIRVLMLGPVVVALSVLPCRAARPHGPHGMAAHRMVPWFILGFLLLMGLRSLAMIPPALLPPIAFATKWFTVLSMAALGLSTDLRCVSRAGGRVTAAVSLSLLMLGGLGFGLIRWDGL